MRTRVSSAAALAMVAFLAACTGDTPAGPSAAAPTVQRIVTPPAPIAIVDGTAAGALYRLAKPAVWNGRLVLYAHGTVLPNAPIALPAEGDQVIGLLAAQGFAVAFSSFASNGWAVKDGADHTAALRQIFTQTFGPPVRTYLVGASQGGLVVTYLAEQHPLDYDGVLSMCAPNAGATWQFGYVGDVRTLFDYFYPHVLPGNTLSLPPLFSVDAQIVAPAVIAMTANPTGAAAIARILQTPVAGNTPAEIGQSIVTALGFHGNLLGNVLSQTGGHSPYDNQNTLYLGLLPFAQLGTINRGVARYPEDAAGEAWAKANYDPTGVIRRPFMELYTSRDPQVPLFNHLAYKINTAVHGSSAFLVQRMIDGFGHCTFTPAQENAAFQDLVKWVELGVRPTP